MEKLKNLANLNQVVKRIKVGVLASSLVLGGLCSNPVFAGDESNEIPFIRPTIQERFQLARENVLDQEFNVGVTMAVSNGCRRAMELVGRIENLMKEINRKVPLYMLAREIGFVFKSCEIFGCAPVALVDNFYDFVRDHEDSRVYDEVSEYLSEARCAIHNLLVRRLPATEWGKSAWFHFRECTLLEVRHDGSQKEILIEISRHLESLRSQVDHRISITDAVYHAFMVALLMHTGNFNDRINIYYYLFEILGDSTTEDQAYGELGQFFEVMRIKYLEIANRIL